MPDTSPRAASTSPPWPQQVGNLFLVSGLAALGSFAGVPGTIALQGYPSVHQLTAPQSEQKWMLNFRHLNPSDGVGPEVSSDVGPVSYNQVPGTNGVYRFTSVNGGLNYKLVPVIAYAGYHLLQEVSSPAKGNIITDSTPLAVLCCSDRGRVPDRIECGRGLSQCSFRFG